MKSIVSPGYILAAIALTALLSAASCTGVPGLGAIGEPQAGDQAAPHGGDRAHEEAGEKAAPAGNPGAANERRARDAEPDANTAVSGDGGRQPGVGEGTASESVTTYGGAFIQEEERWGNTVLARVDDKEISAADLYQTFFLENPVRTRNALQNEILYILAGKEAHRLGVTVDAGAVDKVVKQTIDDHRKRCADFLSDTVDLEKFVETQYAMSFEEYLLTLRRTAVFNLLLDRLVRFGEMSRRRLQVGVIVVKERLLAEEIRRKLVNGASFDILAEKHSLDRSSKVGGILAPIPVDAGHPLYPLVESVIGKKPGDLSEVEPTPYMTETVYRIVKLVADLEPCFDRYGQTADAVEESLRNDPIDLAAIQYWQMNLTTRYKIELKAR